MLRMFSGSTETKSSANCMTAGRQWIRSVTYQVREERCAEEKQPNVQVHRVAEHILMGIIEPASGERSPNALAKYV